MDRPIEAIIEDLENEKNHSIRLNSLDAANYLNEELLQQIEVLRSDNQQVDFLSKVRRPYKSRDFFANFAHFLNFLKMFLWTFHSVRKIC